MSSFSHPILQSDSVCSSPASDNLSLRPVSPPPPPTKQSTLGRNLYHLPISERRNVVIFGDVGVGKSSLVNLIIGRDWAPTSHDAGSCTLKSEEYTVPYGNIEFVLHDTAGLHEAQMDTKEYLEAIYNAHDLISRLERSGGINLLVFVMKAGRISNTTQETYNLFVQVLCKRQIPIVIAITHLEDYDNMDEWWGKNERHFTKYDLRFFGHACVTAARGRRDQYIEKYEQSRGIMWRLILEQSGRVWKENRVSWLTRIALHMRILLAPRYKKKLSDGEQRRTLIKRCGFSVDDANTFIQRIAGPQEGSEVGRWFDA